MEKKINNQNIYMKIPNHGLTIRTRNLVDLQHHLITYMYLGFLMFSICIFISRNTRRYKYPLQKCISIHRWKNIVQLELEWTWSIRFIFFSFFLSISYVNAMDGKIHCSLLRNLLNKRILHWWYEEYWKGLFACLVYFKFVCLFVFGYHIVFFLYVCYCFHFCWNILTRSKQQMQIIIWKSNKE